MLNNKTYNIYVEILRQTKILILAPQLPEYLFKQ